MDPPPQPARLKPAGQRNRFQFWYAGSRSSGPPANGRPPRTPHSATRDPFPPLCRAGASRRSRPGQATCGTSSRLPTIREPVGFNHRCRPRRTDLDVADPSW